MPHRGIFQLEAGDLNKSQSTGLLRSTSFRYPRADATEADISIDPPPHVDDDPRPLCSTSFNQSPELPVKIDPSKGLRAASLSRKPGNTMTMDLDLKSDRRPSKPLDSPGGGPLAYYAGGKTPRNKPRSIVGRVLRICAAMMVILSLLFFVTTSQYSSTAAQSYTPNTEQDVAELMAWITACGGFISPKIDIKLMSTKHGMMRGLFAMDYISTDATLLKVPNTCLLNSANLRVRLTDSDRVILMLMLENRKREQSHFLPYLKVLWPIQWESPDTWSWLQWFMAPSVMKSVATSWLEHWDGGFARIKGYCARLPSWEDSSGGMTCAQFTKAEYYQAIRWTGSRTFTVDTEEGSMKLMVPVLDMLNHEAEETGAQNVAYSFPGQSEGGGAILKSIKPLVPGDELIIPYFATGTHCREEQLLKYGFHNEAAIPCPETYSPDQGLRGRRHLQR